MKNNEKIFKEVMIFIGCIVLVFLVIMGIYCKNVYDDKINNYETTISQLQSENEELTNKVQDLNDNVYNAFNKQAYKLRVEHDGAHITYQQDKFGLFDSYSTSITRVY